MTHQTEGEQIKGESERGYAPLQPDLPVSFEGEGEMAIYHDTNFNTDRAFSTW